MGHQRVRLLEKLLPFLAATLVRVTPARVAAPPPFVSPLFGYHTMLQRDKTNPVWGFVEPGEKVRVEISGHAATVTAAADGRWQAQIIPPPAGGPYTLQIPGPQTVTFISILEAMSGSAAASPTWNSL